MKTYIYGIFTIDDKCLYIGSTDDYKQRFSEHKSKLMKNKHSNKTLQKNVNSIGVDNITFKVVKEINNKNTLLRYFMEMLSISYWNPTSNKCVIQQGMGRIILQKCDKDVAEKLLKVIEDTKEVA